MLIKKVSGICIFLLILTQSCTGPGSRGGEAKLLKDLRPYTEEVLDEFDMIPPERKETLGRISELISGQLSEGVDANLTFICSHNSRRSHMSQVWAQTAAFYYGIDHVFAFSGGTEATACNIRTVHALERAGFSVKESSEGENPVYKIRFSRQRPPVKAFSKLYDDGANPQEEFIALMCCSKADRSCPVVRGASSRFAIHYQDPAECDDTYEEQEVYDERCREISREMFYIMSGVQNNNRP